MDARCGNLQLCLPWWPGVAVIFRGRQLRSSASFFRFPYVSQLSVYHELTKTHVYCALYVFWRVAPLVTNTPSHQLPPARQLTDAAFRQCMAL